MDSAVRIDRGRAQPVLAAASGIFRPRGTSATPDWSCIVASPTGQPWTASDIPRLNVAEDKQSPGSPLGTTVICSFGKTKIHVTKSR